MPLLASSLQVPNDLPQLSRELSRQALQTTCSRFTPNDSGQRSPPTYYRGCWHVVSRGFFLGYRHHRHREKRAYTPKGFVTHAALLGQAFAHCPKFLTAASRRSLGRLSVPVWPSILSDRLPITALVGRYPSN